MRQAARRPGRAPASRVSGGAAQHPGLECDEFGADRDHFAGLARDATTTRPLTGRGNLDRRLVGHDLGDDLVFLDRVADLDLPFDDLGRDRAFTEVRHLEDVAAHAASMTAFRALATRAWPGKVFPFEGVRIRRVPARDPQDRGLRFQKQFSWIGRRELRAEAGESRRLMHDHAAAGPCDRFADRVGIQRHHRSHVDDLRVESEAAGRGLADMHHGAIGDDRQVAARAHDFGLADRHVEMPVRHLALRVRAPRHGRLVRDRRRTGRCRCASARRRSPGRRPRSPTISSPFAS